MTDKEKCDLYMELARLQQDSFDKRRDIEWKLSLALWGGILFATNGIAGKIPACTSFILGYVALFFAYVFLWLRGLWTANNTDKQFRDIYKSCALRIPEVGYDFANHNDKEKIRYEEEGFFAFLLKENWAMLSQILITLLVLTLSLLWLHLAFAYKG